MSTCPAPGTIPDIEPSLNMSLQGWVEGQIDGWLQGKKLCGGKQYRAAGVNSKKIRIVQYLAKEKDITEYIFYHSIYRSIKARQG